MSQLRIRSTCYPTTRNVFSGEEFEQLEELAEEYGTETAWTNDKKPYMMLMGANDTTIHIPQDSERNIAHKILYSLNHNKWSKFVVQSYEYESEEGEWNQKFESEIDTNYETYARFEEAYSDIKERVKVRESKHESASALEELFGADT